MSLLVGLLLLFSLLAQPSQPKNLKDIYKESRDSVLLLLAREKKNEVSTGTAFAIDAKGSFLTAWHIIENAEELLLISSKKQIHLVKKVVWKDKDLDLAILKVEGAHFKPIPLSSYKDSSVGESLAIISYPKGLEVGGLESTLAKGLLSSIRERFVSERDEPYSPIYDKDNPKVIGEKEFFKQFNKDCSLASSNSEEGLDLFKCENNRLAIIDRQRGDNVIFNNLDLVIKKENSMFLFENLKKEQPKIHKFLGAMIQYTTPISNGSSGGPIFNEKGEVIAVVNSYLQSAQNVNFGRPVDYLPSQFLKQNKLAIKTHKRKFKQRNQAKQTLMTVKRQNKGCNYETLELSGNLNIIKCGNGEFMIVENLEDTNIYSENKFDALMKKFMSLDKAE
ncbi:MAG: serine protease [Candidatus Caenarcaniphilales bacterium]|nr:serine protease [Candidatus Caenarcaniphilales bacterium]